MLTKYILKSSIFDRNRKLILTKDYLEFENKNEISDLFSRINKSDMIDFKHEFEHLFFYKFPIGKRYSITFLDKDSNKLRMGFKEYFWNNLNYNQVYSEIINKIWEYYFTDIVKSYNEKFTNNHPLDFKILKLDQTGIYLNSAKRLITWDILDYKEYTTYFVIFNKDNPNEFQRMSFNEWNSEVIFSLIRTIKNSKK
jgi:hypothetical protein